MRKLLISLCAVAITVLCGCDREVVTPQRIVPLYRMMADFEKMNSAAQDRFMHDDSAEIMAMIQVLGGDTLSRNELESWSRSMPVSIFTPATDSVFPTLEPLEHKLGRILSRARDGGFDLPSRSYAAVVWGNRKSIVFVDTVMLIALNHYLGADYDGYTHWPAYMRVDKTPDRLPYDIAEALVGARYPYRRTDQSTALSRIVYEGAITAAKIELVPDANMAGALGYTEKQLEWLDEHEKEIWMQIVGKDLLYDTSETTADRLVAPAPSTGIISPYTPGRIGRYIGYRIICAYRRQNADVTLPQMLRPAFYDNPSILVEAAYEGE